MAQTGKKWYVLRAVSGKEAKVKEYIEAELKHNELLSKYVSQVVIPMEKHAALRGQKRVVKEKIALPGYVLSGDETRWRQTRVEEGAASWRAARLYLFCSTKT